jgi:hypothetical protein
MNNRVFYKSSVLKDISDKASSFVRGPISISHDEEDFIYIGSRLPINHAYIMIENVEPPEPEEGDPPLPPPVEAEVKVEYWDGTSWISAVDAVDLTNSLRNSGHIEFTPNKLYRWRRSDTNGPTQTIAGLSSVSVYDLYWCRISWSESIGPKILNFIGTKFSSDQELALEYPDLVRPSVISSFTSGKTDWEDQHLLAAKILAADLIQMQVIKDQSQILNWRDYTDASVHKVAEIAFNAFGESYREQSIAARQEYKQRISRKVHRVDTDSDAIESVHEMTNTSGWLSR